MTISRDKPDISLYPVSQNIPDRSLAYLSLQNRAGTMKISVQLTSVYLTQNWEKFALNILTDGWGFLAINVTSPNIPMSQIIPDRPLAYNFPLDFAGKMKIICSFDSLQLTQIVKNLS